MFKAASIFSKVTSIIMGLIFLAGGLVFFLFFDPDAYDMEGTGTIVEITEHYESVGEDMELMHDVYIDYTAGGQTFTNVAYFSYDSSMKVGDEVSFYYMSEDPSQIAGSDKSWTPYFGLGFAVIGLIMLVVTVVKIVKKQPF